MKRMTGAILVAALCTGCLSNPGSMISKTLSSAIQSGFEAGHDEPGSAAGAIEPTGTERGQDSIEAAIERFDLDSLKRLVGSEKDINKLIDPGTPVLIMSERAMGRTGDVNDMTGYLVSKKAYILQRDAQGASLDDVVRELGIEETPRHDRIIALMSGPKQRYQEALDADSPEAIDGLSAYVPMDKFLLLDAARRGAFAIIEKALAAGVPSSSSDPRTGESALHLVCTYQNSKPFDARIAAAKALIAAGASANAVDNADRTPLSYLVETAVRDGYRKLGNPENLFLVLLDGGADPAGAMYQGQGALYYAVNLSMPAVAAALMDSGAVLDAKTLAANGWTVAMVKTFIDRGAAPRLFVPKIGYLIDSAEQRALIDLLLDKGVAATDIDPQPMYAHFENVRYLVDRGASINSSNILLNAVVQFSGMDAVRYLVEHGADLDRRYSNGRTIMHYVAMSDKGDRELADYLLMMGAPLNELDGDGRTPLDVLPKRKSELRAYLVSQGAVSGK